MSDRDKNFEQKLSEAESGQIGSAGEFMGLIGDEINNQTAEIHARIAECISKLKTNEQSIKDLHARYTKAIDPDKKNELKGQIIKALERYVRDLAQKLEPKYTRGYLFDNAMNKAAKEANKIFTFAKLNRRHISGSYSSFVANDFTLIEG